MQAEMNLLDEAQNAAANAVGNVVVAAVPGSGKTTVLVERMRRLVEMGADPSRILVATFLKEATKEITRRIDSALGTHASSVHVKTLHSLGFNIVRRWGGVLSHGFAIAKLLDGKDLATRYRGALIQAAEDLELMHLVKPGVGQPQVRWKTLQRYASTANDLMFGPEDASGSEEKLKELARAGIKPNPEELLLLGRAFYCLELSKLEDGWLCFDDMINKACVILQRSEEAATEARVSYDHVLVDEFQDTSPSQQALILAHASEAKLVIVGDDDQCIYGWRRANPQFLLDATKDPRFTTIKLEKNYRSGDKILEKAQLLIENNKVRVPKVLSPTRYGGGITTSCHENQTQEARYVADMIQCSIAGGTKPQEIMALFRTNAQMAYLSAELTERDVPHRLPPGSKSFADLPEVVDAEAYLKLAMNPYDDSALSRVHDRPWRFLPRGWISEISAAAKLSGGSIYTTMLGRRHEAGRPEIRFVDFIRSIHALSSSGKSTHSILSHALGSSGYLEWLSSDEDEQDNLSMENVQKAMEMARDVSEPREFVGKLLAMRKAPSRKTRRSAAVLLSTIHRAKGLESDEVYVCGCRPGLLPHAKACSSLEEERRLCYVACTRARHRLHISRDVGKDDELDAAVAATDFMVEMGLTT